jgi:hypothetical protein
MTRSLKRWWRVSRLPLVALGLASIAVVAHEVSSRRPRPRSVGELVDRLRAAGVQLRVVAVVQSGQDLENGAFLCERDYPWVDLSRLGRSPEHQADWVGVVHAQRWPDHEGSVEFILREWQTCAARVGDVLLFGDAELLRRFVDALES